MMENKKTRPKTTKADNPVVNNNTDKCLKCISDNKNLNIFIDVYGKTPIKTGKPELADKQKLAGVIQKKIQKSTSNSPAGKLAGWTIAVKDNICVKGRRTTCASRLLENYISPFNASVIEKLLKEDAVIIGKTNMDEFAMGSSSETSFFGPVKNPHNPEYIPGGSSGGSAASVASGLSRASLGSDTGGSIRQPASMCGIVGLKPTYGRISRYGLVSFASSLDQIGPVTANVEDSALLLEVMAGYDPKDSTSSGIPVPPYSERLDKPVNKIRFGIPEEYFGEGLDPEIREKIFSIVEGLKKSGTKTGKVSLPHSEYCLADYYIISSAEASSNLARYDGVRYGFRDGNGCTDRDGKYDEKNSALEEMYVKIRSDGFGKEVKRRIMMGTYVLSSGYYDAYYKKAQKVRRLIQNDFFSAFQKADCLITPSSPTTAFKIGEKIKSPMSMYLSDIYTVSANLAGVPAISVPCGKAQNGLPFGLQLIGKPFDEETLLAAAYFIEKNLVD